MGSAHLYGNSNSLGGHPLRKFSHHPLDSNWISPLVNLQVNTQFVISLCIFQQELQIPLGGYPLLQCDHHLSLHTLQLYHTKG